MIQITDRLIAIPVPENSEDFHVIHNGTRVCHFSPNYKRYDIPNGYKIVGTITKSGEFEGFDCEKYVEKANSLGEEYYKDYNNSTKSGTYFSKEESFISLLNSKGIFLEELNNQKILILEKI